MSTEPKTARVAVVTGGSRGIGRAIAVRLAEDGYDVGFCYRGNTSAAKETAELVRAAGRETYAEAVDVADREAVRAFVANVEERLGAPYAVVACAGITRDRALAVMPPEDWDAVLRTNLDGVFHLCRATTFGMMRRRAGVVVAVSSVVGLGGNAGQANYAASKAGMHGFTRSLAKEVGRYGVRANAVAPGFIESDMVADLPAAVRTNAQENIPLGRFGEPAQVADAVSFLVSERASYITGAILRVDGGIGL
jgi:3-oxoacyl-[acyl-carrier protein] reductase